MPKVSVISPVYGVEQFVSRAAESMFSQTLEDVEFIFVDDCTPDNSIQIIKDVLDRFPERANQVNIIRHEKNRGLPSARNSGLEAASGEYIFHWDSDDYADPDMLERMYNYAAKEDFDIIWADWYLTFKQKERYMDQPSYSTTIEALKAMLGGAMKYNVWNKLAKRSLYIDYDIRFPDGFGMGEDMTMMLLFAHAERVSHIGKAFYHYLKTNSNAFSHGVNHKHFNDLKRNVNWITDQLRSHCCSDLSKEINYLKLQSKYPLLANTCDKKMYRMWNEWFPEANASIGKNPYMGKRARMLQSFAHHRQYWLVMLHYTLVSKVIYGILYR